MTATAKTINMTTPRCDITENVDDRDAPNIYPYKKCSVCGDRKSCGNYKEDDWFCEDCADGSDYDFDDDRYVCGVCGKTEPKDVEWDVGDPLDFCGDVVCPDCEAP